MAYNKGMVWVLSLGGSIVAPKGCEELVDVHFVQQFYSLICKRIGTGDTFIVIVGGGNPARLYQNAHKKLDARLCETHEPMHGSEFIKSVCENATDDAMDRIGIAATHLNAAFIREVFAEHAEKDIVTNPETENIVFTKPVLIGAGWKPGFSTDLDAVILARRFEAKTIINISNIAQVYSADPTHDPHAKPLTSIRWDEMIEMVGANWKPGMNVPFDPIACTQARAFGLEVISIGASIANFEAVLEGTSYIGTRIW